MKRVPIVTVVVAACGLASCATPRCVPTTLVVAERERIDHLERRIESQTLDPVFGRVRDVSKDVVVPSYWVRATTGDWIAVDEATWRQAERGGELEVCR